MADNLAYSIAGRYVLDGHDLADTAAKFGLESDALKAYLEKPLGSPSPAVIPMDDLDALVADVKANGRPPGKTLAEMTPEDVRDCGHGHIKPPGRWPDCDICLAAGRAAGLLPTTAEELDEAREILAQHQAEQVVEDLHYSEFYLPRSALADLPRGEPLIDGVIDKHTLFVVAGRDQTYKSFLVLDWLCCLATGRPWMGREVEQTNVLYVVGEGAWGLNDRITAWETARGEKVEDWWFTVRRAPVNLFKQAAAFQDLLARIKLENYGVVVFDTLQRMASGADQNSARDAGVIVESLDAVRKATGGAAGVVAHTDKGDNDTRGSSAFEDDADVVWRTRRDEDEQTITVTLAKRKDGPAGTTIELRPKLIDGTGSLILSDARGFTPDLDRVPAHATAILRLLDSNAIGDAGLSATPIADALNLSGKGHLYRALEWLIDKGFVHKSDTGRYPSYLITQQGHERITAGQDV